jgi:para-nitrobenzyl esterase
MASTEEDCLCLNVTTPLKVDSAHLKPVMVWIHGDGSVGAGHLFNPARLVETGDVIVVTINFRLGIFGGFGYPGLEGSGTFGLQDQQAALRWVQRNIAYFGGDPDNVTLFGVSYGALAASAQLMSPKARGLFHKVILQSGFALMDMPADSMIPGMEAMPWFGWRSQKEIEQLGVHVAGQLKQPDLKALRQTQVKELLPFLSHFMPYGYQTEVLPARPDQALQTGLFNRVPVLAGNTLDEHRTFVGLFRVLAGYPVTKESYDSLLRAAFGRYANQVRKRYPLTAYASPATAWATVLTDRMWARATYRQHQQLAQYVPVYAYEFADQQAPSDLPFPEELPPGAFHFAEVDYLFATSQFEAKLTPAQRLLSAQMIRYWTNFARKGDPNGEGLPVWQPFSSSEAAPFVQTLAPDSSGLSVTDYLKVHQLDFWNSMP